MTTAKKILMIATVLVAAAIAAPLALGQDATTAPCVPVDPAYDNCGQQPAPDSGDPCDPASVAYNTTVCQQVSTPPVRTPTRSHHHTRSGPCVPHGNGELCRGGSGSDRIVASNGNDTIYGGGGNDTLHALPGNDKAYGQGGNDIILGDELGKAGNDFIDGGAGNDRVFGMGGNDQVHGGSGNDVVHGGKGSDHMYGDAGNDVLDDAPRNGPSGTDWFYGGAGRDEIFSRDGTKDYVDCGSGSDVAKVDHRDVVAGNCESVIRQG